MTANNDDIYIDLLLSNSLQTSKNQRVPVSFMQNQSQPILKNTNGYKLSIIRFALNTETLPIFIPSMQKGSNVNTIYSVTMEYNGVYYQQYMEFAPQNANPIDNDEYFYVYNYQYLIYLMNQCLTSCLEELGSLTSLEYTVPPSLTFNPDTQKCTMLINDLYYGYNESDKINIYMNFPMYALLSGLPANIVNKDIGGMDYQLNNLISQDKSKLSQDYSTVALWNPISSVIFTTNLIPIYQSQTPPIQIYRNGSIINNSSTSNFLNIITDFVGNDLTFVPYIQYSAQVYRYLSLKQNSEIRNIDLQVYWLNKNNGVLKPLYLGVGSSCQVKLFLTKSF